MKQLVEKESRIQKVDGPSKKQHVVQEYKQIKVHIREANNNTINHSD